MAASRMGRPLVMIDLAVPRDIEPSVRDCPGIALYDMDDLQAGGGAQPERAQGRGRGGARARARGGGALRRLARQPRRGADDLGAAPARRRDRRAGAARERVALGVALRGGPRAARRRWPARSSAGCSTSPRAAARRRRARAPPTATCTRCTSCSGSRPRWRRTRTRPPRSPALDARRRAAAGDPLGTRGSALALAQAQLGGGAPRAGEVELVPIRTSGDPHRRRRGAPPHGSDDKSRFVKEIEEALLAGRDRPGGALGEGRPGRAPARALDRGRARAGRRTRRALRRRVARRAGAEGAVVGTASLRRRASCWRCDRTSRSRTCAATWTRGCAASPRGTSTRSCWPQAGLDRLGRGRRGSPLDPDGFVPGAGPGLPRARGARANDGGPLDLARGADRPTTPRRLTAERALWWRSAPPATRPSARTPARRATRSRHSVRRHARRLALDPRRARVPTPRRRATGAPGRSERLLAAGRGRAACRGRAGRRPVGFGMAGIVYLVGAGPGRPRAADRARRSS